MQDGYAVLSSDGPGEYEVAFEAFAGAAPRTLQPGTVAYIGTGGPLPEGADAGGWAVCGGVGWYVRWGACCLFIPLNVVGVASLVPPCSGANRRHRLPRRR